jgi:N-formylglutamate amidohydrolase
MAMTPSSPAFELIDPVRSGPVVVSVPHAGRDYAPEMHARLRAPAEKLLPLEDRLVDCIARDLRETAVLIARVPRAWIDINRNEAEIDPGLVEGIAASRVMLTPKVRNGLGLIPRRLAGVGELWRSRLALAEVQARIASVHRPYHERLRALTGRALGQHGVAVLLDLHSMPPLAGAGRPRIVIGNRFGHTAAPWVTARIAETCRVHGLSWQENSPYAGGHIVERHGTPTRGVHAVQLEIDRSLYLDSGLDCIAPAGLARCQAFLADTVIALTAGALETVLPLAAE